VPEQRSVKIGADERTGWSSDRPRRGNAPERKPDISVRGRVLEPTDRLRYTPGSLVLVAAADPGHAEQYLHGVLEDRPALISPGRVQRLLQGRVPDEQLEAQAATVLETAVTKRLDNGDAVVLVLGDVEDRERWLQAAASRRRPRHLILLEGSDEGRLAGLRKALLAESLGDEGFHTAIRLGGSAANEVKKLVFRAPQRDDD
jgi:hypothetical protein